ncbi:MAG: DUF1937 family protein [Gemmataceae bacterium]|nr:DUF1937 family protein [Gemmataceae bacterium]
MIYLASPYSHPDPAVRAQRFREACRAAAALVQAGRVVFAPVVHSHPLVEFGVPTDWAFWQQTDQRFLEQCDEVVILMLDGWRESVGVEAEIEIARAFGKPTRFLEPSLGDTPGTPTLAHVATEVAR